ncbi:MAG: glycosyltransferase family 2 protein [Candidatus Aminicenantes bacterium]|nr:glycosyltransferase family 2 protein [Candidatus Aminicenantes bacterium]
MKAIFLSVVIVAKNEEKNIVRCITSVLAGTVNLPATEVLLVDSFSTDGTVAMACRYPIGIIQLQKEWPHSPAAGRFAGVNNTAGKYVLIIDGDMELLPGWLDRALGFMENHPNVAAVVGKNYDVYDKGSGVFAPPRLGRNSLVSGEVACQVDYVFESSLFRRQSLQEAGNFQPFLRAEEEAEISHRLRLNGHELYYLPFPAVHHYTQKRNSLKETRRRTRARLHAGIADLVSLGLRGGNFSLVWGRCRIYFLFAAMLGLGLAMVAGGLLWRKHGFVLGGALLLPAYVLWMAVKKKSVPEAVAVTLDKTIVVANFFPALFRKLKRAADYPRDVLWIKSI